MAMELTLSFDSYNKPLIKLDADADICRILRCLIRKQDNPVLGNLCFDISKYRFEDIDYLSRSLDSDISAHMARVLPDIIITEIKVLKVNRNTLMISIEVLGKSMKSRKKYLTQLSQDKAMNVNLDAIKDIT